jgi:hypothetical protein
MSESDKSTLSKVVLRWLRLKAELEQLGKVLLSLIGGITRPKGVFHERLLKQLLDVHYVI